jgi:hypothetical protein
MHFFQFAVVFLLQFSLRVAYFNNFLIQAIHFLGTFLLQSLNGGMTLRYLSAQYNTQNNLN